MCLWGQQEALTLRSAQVLQCFRQRDKKAHCPLSIMVPYSSMYTDRLVSSTWFLSTDPCYTSLYLSTLASGCCSHQVQDIDACVKQPQFLHPPSSSPAYESTSPPEACGRYAGLNATDFWPCFCSNFQQVSYNNIMFTFYVAWESDINHAKSN